MRKLLLCAALALPACAIPAAAQPYDRDYDYRYDNPTNDAVRACREALSQAVDRDEYERQLAECRDAEMRARAPDERWDEGADAPGYDYNDDATDPDDGYAPDYGNDQPYYASPYGDGAYDTPSVPYGNDLNDRDW